MERSRTVYARAAGSKATAELVIKDFLVLMEASKPGKYFKSDTFMVGDTQMEVKVYPNGVTDEYKGYVSVYLFNKGAADITVKCQFIREAETHSFDNVVCANQKVGFFDFLSHADATKIYKEKDFVVTANVEIPGEHLKIIGEVVVAKKFSMNKNLYEKMQRSDFTLVFNRAEVPCHKIVLAAASPVFEAMVESNHLEALESKANIDLSEEVGRSFVKYLYTGELEENILKEQTLAFLELGQKYDIQELKDLAEQELLEQLDRKNMVEFVFMGDLFSAEKIFEAALKMTKANMSWLRNQV